MKPFTFQIDLPVLNQWRNVHLLRTSVQNCFVAVFSNIDGCNAIAMVTGELVENAVKYGAWEESNENSFRLFIYGKPGVVTIQVENPLAPGSAAGAELGKILAWIDSQPSPADAFNTKLLEIASKPRGDGESSGLGLVRCAYEGNAKLRHEIVDDGRTVRVVAELKVPA